MLLQRGDRAQHGVDGLPQETGVGDAPRGIRVMGELVQIVANVRELADQLRMGVGPAHPRNGPQRRFPHVPRDRHPTRPGVLDHGGELGRRIANELDHAPRLSHRVSPAGRARRVCPSLECRRRE